MSGKIENFDAFRKNAEIVKKYAKGRAMCINDLPHREAMQLIQNELDAVKSYTVQLIDFTNSDGLGIMEFVYVLVAMSRTLKMLKKSIRDFDPQLYVKYQEALEMCDHYITSSTVVVPKNGEKHE